jgi:MerR family Zn(II)-responsive transcriptional regulator of zntA
MAGKQELFKIGDTTRILGVTPRTLRFYEEEGLVEPVRTPKGTRLYAKEDIERLQVVQLMTAVGIPLQEIKVLSRIRSNSKTGDQASQNILSTLEEMREMVVEKIRLHQRLLKELDESAKKVSECAGCTQPPTPGNCIECAVVHEVNRPFIMRLLIDQTNEGSPSS